MIKQTGGVLSYKGRFHSISLSTANEYNFLLRGCCNLCGKSKNFSTKQLEKDGINSSAKIHEFGPKFKCGKCSGKSINFNWVERPNPNGRDDEFPVYQSDKKIPDSQQPYRTSTMKETFTPRKEAKPYARFINEPLGSREDFKKDSRANRSSSRLYKL